MISSKIYKAVNDVLDAYSNEGVKPEHLLNYLNVNEDNFKFMYSRVYRKLTMEQVSFESSDLVEALKDVVRDRIAFYNDTVGRMTNENKDQWAEVSEVSDKIKELTAEDAIKNADEIDKLESHLRALTGTFG